MRALDVNVLVYAHRQDAARHEDYRNFVEAARSDAEPLALSSLVLSAFVRVVTHPRVFGDPTPPAVALAYCEALRSSPSVLPLEPGPGHWATFRRLCEEADARGNRIPDAYLAALAIEAGATWWSADRGFARYPGLRWRHPLDAGS